MKKFDQEVENNSFNKTSPVPTICTSCGFDFELQRDPGERRGQVNYLTCQNKTGKVITDKPGRFLKQDSHGVYLGSSKSGYPLTDDYSYVAWVVWCDRCHSNAVRVQESHKNSSKLHNYQSISIEELKNKLSVS